MIDLLSTLVFLCNTSMATLPADESPRPNIVVFLCDDLGYGDLGCFGHPIIKTPNLDALAASGIKLTSCYSAAPVCSPSRVGLLTGRSPNRAGVYDWIPPGERKRPDQRHQVHMRRSETTIAQVLKTAGYATCLAGKWHCNSLFNSSKQPQPGDFGFDHWFATQNNAGPSHADPKNFVRNGVPVGKIEGFSCQIVVEESIAFLNRRKEPERIKPFFLFIPFHEPHEPVASPPDLVASYRKQARTDDEAQYFANVANVDRAVGRLLEHLKTTRQLDNTLVIFTSDNGPETLKRYRGAERSYGRPDPLRGMKLWTTEAGFRVPGIISWPSRIKKSTVSDEIVSSLDFLPTFCQLAGAKKPARPIDGVSLLPFLEGKALSRPKPLLWCYYNAINEQRVAMRDGPWKMLARLHQGKLRRLSNVNTKNQKAVTEARLTDFELYRVTDDIGETKNLSKTHPEQLTILKTKMQSRYRELIEDSLVWQPQ